jgi:hypothetical protein
MSGVTLTQLYQLAHSNGDFQGGRRLRQHDGQFEAWCQLIDAFDEGSRRHRRLALFPANREVPECAEGYGVQGASRRDGAAPAAAAGRVLVGVSAL